MRNLMVMVRQRMRAALHAVSCGTDAAAIGAALAFAVVGFAP